MTMATASHRSLRARIRRIAALALLASGWVGALTACGPLRQENPDRELQLPAEVSAGLRFRWHHVTGADGYRPVFMRMTGAAVCTVLVDQAKSPEFVIQRDSLPSGLAHGLQMNLEIRAMRKGTALVPMGVRPRQAP